jgi:hypothetical protein
VQLVPPVHASPQAPQLSESASRFTHGPLQDVVPRGQAHALAVQTWQAPPWQTSVPGAQAWPQAPQLAGSVLGSTHAPPHAVPLAQPQAPPAQVCAEGQALPQAPQLPGSVPTSTQWPLHAVSPPAHVPAQDPEEHTSPTTHA